MGVSGRKRPRFSPRIGAEGRAEKLELCLRDDFDPELIMESGQCFRIRRLSDGAYRFVTGSSVLYLRQMGAGRFDLSCTGGEWSRVWTPYFDLSRSYRALRERAAGRHPFVDSAMAHGAGLRILRQDPWETLVSFIVSQRKSIPAITGAVELLARRWGSPLETERGTVFAFPAPEALAAATEEELRACSLGYRAPYVLDAARKAAGGELDLAALASLEDEALFRALQSVYGVGKKVAECVCLFGYGRLSRVPVDVWIDRAIREECGGCEPFSRYGSDAGVIQQYVFFAMREGRKGFSRRREAEKGEGA